MAQCFAPILVKATGAKQLRSGYHHLGHVQPVRCGHCIGCRMTHASNWATRLQHEASRHEATCFLTLTFDDAHLPDPPTVSRRDVQLFLKRLRKEVHPVRIRFFACGEYGSINKRPHYHVILFGFDFLKDRYPWSRINNHLHYRSPTLEAAWPYGHATIASVTRESAGYVARYSLKKAQAWTDTQGSPETRINAQTGEVYEVHPEFIQMSTRPGIGFYWADQFKSDCFPSGFVTIDGQKLPVPPAYKRHYAKETQPALERAILTAEVAAQKKAAARQDDNTPERRADKEELLHLRATSLKRTLE